MIELKLFNHLDQECERNWRDFEKNSIFNFFQSIDYIKKLLDVNNTNIKIIFVYFADELIAIYPFEIRNLFGVKILQWIGNNNSDYCNPLISNNYIKTINEQKFNIIWDQILKKIKDFDLIFLNNQPSEILGNDNPFVKFLKNVKQTKIYKIELLENYEKYLKSVKDKDKKYAYELHRVNIKYEKLKQMHQIDINIDQINNNINDLDLIFINKSRQLEFKKKKYHLDINFFNLFKELIKKDKENFCLAKFSIDKKLVSACLLINFKNDVYYYMPVLMSDEYNKFKPGKILLSNIIQWAITKKKKFLDLGLGEEHYKKHFSNNNSFVQKYLSYFSFKGKIIFFILKFIIFLGY